MSFAIDHGRKDEFPTISESILETVTFIYFYFLSFFLGFMIVILIGIIYDRQEIVLMMLMKLILQRLIQV